MKFEMIEDTVQLGERGYIRHKVDELKDGELIQRCVFCNEIIKDLNPPKDSVRFIIKEGGGVDDNYIERGMAAGFVYVSIQKNPSTVIHEMLKDFGATMPTDFTDCRISNS